MTTKQHGSLVDTEAAGNGYHGRCEYCGLALVTDLGYTSWSGTECNPRPVTKEDELPELVQSYALFHGMIFDVVDGVACYIKPYDRIYTIKEIVENIIEIKETDSDDTSFHL